MTNKFILFSLFFFLFTLNSSLTMANTISTEEGFSIIIPSEFEKSPKERSDVQPQKKRTQKRKASKCRIVFVRTGFLCLKEPVLFLTGFVRNYRNK